MLSSLKGSIDESFHARVLAVAGAATIVTDLAGRVVFWNEAATNLFGWTAEEAIGGSSIELTVAEAKALDAESIMDELRAGRTWSGEFTLRDRRGRTFPALVTDTPVFDDDGRLSAIVGVSVDITEQRNAQAALEASEHLYRRIFRDGIDAMARLVELRDPYLDGHQRRVGVLAGLISQRLGFDEHFVEGISIAGQVHDIGKLAIPAEILTRPARLSPAEFELVKVHCQAGHDVLAPIEGPWPTSTVVLQHHERLDGSGYPNGLVGDEIAIQSRIVAVADVLEAVSAHRPYRPARGIEAACDVLRAGRSMLLDPDAVDACLALVADGTAVEVFRGAHTAPT